MPDSSNVHIYLGPPGYATRVVKITGTLIDRGVFDRIVIVATDGDGGPATESLGPRREVWRVARKHKDAKAAGWVKAFGVLLWSVSVLRALARHRIDCVNCHSLSVLPLSVALKVLKRSRLVYDTHELETETVATGELRRSLAKAVERSLMPFVDEIAVVNASIGEWYQRLYDRKAWVVKNVPHQIHHAPARTGKLRRALGIADDQLVFLFQGQLSRRRGIHLLLQAFMGIPDRHLVFLGYGELANLVQDYSRTQPNIHYHPAVPPDKLHEYTPDADAGLCMFENACLNHYLALPNKLFEYLVSGIPVIASDFPEMARVIAAFDCGWCTPVDAGLVRRLVLSVDRGAISARRSNIERNRENFGWQIEEEVLMTMYQRIVPSMREDRISVARA